MIGQHIFVFQNAAQKLQKELKNYLNCLKGELRINVWFRAKFANFLHLQEHEHE